MEELLKMPDKDFLYKGEQYKLIHLEDGELELKCNMTGKYLTAQIDDDEVFIFFESRFRTLKKVYEYYNRKV